MHKFCHVFAVQNSVYCCIMRIAFWNRNRLQCRKLWNIIKGFQCTWVFQLFNLYQRSHNGIFTPINITDSFTETETSHISTIMFIIVNITISNLIFMSLVSKRTGNFTNCIIHGQKINHINHTRFYNFIFEDSLLKCIAHV